MNLLIGYFRVKRYLLSKIKVDIYGHCYILKAVTIGDETVIGGGSVETKTSPAREIWAGNPAKFLNIKVWTNGILKSNL